MGTLLDALQPNPQATSFPLPRVVTGQGSAGSSVSEGPLINGIPMPGQWLLTRATREFGWQEQRANFMTGAYLVPIGDPLAPIEYDIKIWNSADAAIFRQLLKTLLKKPVTVVPGSASSTAALGIDDPSLKDLGIDKVVIVSISALLNPLVTSGGKGAWTSKAGFKEYRPAIPAPPIPDQNIPDPGAVTPAAATNLATVNASVTAGAAQLQSTAARKLLQGG
jgi:hypothetical protein